MKKLLFVPLAFLLAACGGGGSEPAPNGVATTFGAQRVTVLNGSVSTGAELSGTGAVLFEKDYGSFRSAGSYALDFTLEDGGSLTLVSHADSALNGGWEMEFRRQGSGPGSLLVTITAQGITRDTQNSSGAEVFSGFNAAQALRFQIDVHNDETPAHALVWSRLVAEDFREELAVLNSEENDNSPGIGTGTRWGLKLNRATVTRADPSETKYNH